MKKILITYSLLLLTIITMAQTYHLEPVTTFESNERYVFLQDGYVMSNVLVNKALQTTNSYQTEQLTGQENYVWRIVKKNNTNYTLQKLLSTRQQLSCGKCQRTVANHQQQGHAVVFQHYE
jgi:hypothetical protein